MPFAIYGGTCPTHSDCICIVTMDGSHNMLEHEVLAGAASDYEATGRATTWLADAGLQGRIIVTRDPLTYQVELW